MFVGLALINFDEALGFFPFIVGYWFPKNPNKKFFPFMILL